jgi:chromatin remodeling complex protein RSC6
MSNSQVPSSNTPVEKSPAPPPPPNEMGEKFGGILNTLGSFRAQITMLQNQVRSLEKTVNKEMKHMAREVKKNKNKGNRKPSGFAVPTNISSDLCDFMGKQAGSQVARTEVTQYIIQYIKQKDLQWAENRKIIKPDEPLKKLLGVEDGDEVTYFNLQKFMNKHFVKNVVSKEKSNHN